jgi:hypothetical protein
MAQVTGAGSLNTSYADLAREVDALVSRSDSEPDGKASDAIVPFRAKSKLAFTLVCAKLIETFTPTPCRWPSR